MKLLVLGESDSQGGGLPDKSLAWGNLLPVELERQIGTEVESTHLSFYTHSSTALAYLEKVLERGPFDVVAFSTTSIGFTMLSVDRRVARLLGKRAGDAFKHGVDTLTQKGIRRHRRKPYGKAVRRVDRAVRTIARKTIGQEAMASYEQVLENHRQVIARLARLEDTEVVVLGPTDHGGTFARTVKRTQPRVVTFRAALREETERRRMTWIDRQKLSEVAADRDAEFTDGLHKGPAFHRRIVDATVHAIVPRLAPVVADANRAGGPS